jgi:hypothetical protein
MPRSKPPFAERSRPSPRRLQRRKNAGYILRLELWTRKRIHKLAHDHWIDQESWFTGEVFAANCPLCKELADGNRNSADSKRDAGAKPGPK